MFNDKNKFYKIKIVNVTIYIPASSACELSLSISSPSSWFFVSLRAAASSVSTFKYNVVSKFFKCYISLFNHLPGLISTSSVISSLQLSLGSFTNCALSILFSNFDLLQTFSFNFWCLLDSLLELLLSSQLSSFTWAIS